jgi:UDP-glucose 4-epimerase
MTLKQPPAVVAVTGALGYIGRRTVARLAAEPSTQRVVATDIRPLSQTHPFASDPKITFVQQDIIHPLEDAFREHGVEAVVHLAFVLRQDRNRRVGELTNVEGAASLLRACAGANVHRIVVLSSSTVYGPHPDNPMPLTEDAPVRPPWAFQYAWDKAQSERLFQEHATSHPGTELSVLRGCVVMGPSADNFITSAMFRPMLIGIRSADPPLQFVHEDDIVELLWRFVSEPHPGVYNVAGPGEVRWSELALMAGRRMVWLPAAMAYTLTQLTWWLRLQSDSPAVGLDWVRYPWVVSTERLARELVYRFQHTTEQALKSYLATRAR